MGTENETVVLGAGLAGMVASIILIKKVAAWTGLDD